MMDCCMLDGYRMRVNREEEGRAGQVDVRSEQVEIRLIRKMTSRDRCQGLVCISGRHGAVGEQTSVQGSHSIAWGDERR
jgi:hypothetical protein